MSHVKNAGSYSRLVDICTGFGGKYNPGRPTLQLIAMRALLEEAQSSLRDVSQKRNALSSITNDRAQAFAELEKLTGQITGTLLASQVSEETLANARYYTRLITGRLKSSTSRPPVAGDDADTQPPTVRPITQLSYVVKAHNFMRLAQLVGQVEGYQTASPRLQPAALIETANGLKALNEAWSQARVALSNARIHRNTLLYKGPEALLNNASAVKSYIRAEFGPRSQESALLSELSFTKLKVK